MEEENFMLHYRMGSRSIVLVAVPQKSTTVHILDATSPWGVSLDLGFDSLGLRSAVSRSIFSFALFSSVKVGEVYLKASLVVLRNLSICNLTQIFVFLDFVLQ